MKSFLWCLLGLVFFSCVSDARGDLFTIDVEQDRDSYIRRNNATGNPITVVTVDSNNTGSTLDPSAGLYVGRVSHSAGSFSSVAVLPFKLPVIPAGYTIVDANFSFSAFQIGSGLLSADLYGLGSRASASVEADDFYESSGTDTSDATLLQNAILNTSLNLTDSFSQLETDANADSALVDYLNDQFSAGASAGDFVFLRFNFEDFLGAGSAYYRIGSSVETGSVNGASLSITTAAVPEPSAFLFGTLVCVVSGLRYSRRGRRCRA